MVRSYGMSYSTKYYGHTISFPIQPQKKNPFTMVYGMDAMFPIEIDTPSRHHYQSRQEVNDAELKCAADLIDELRDTAYIWEFTDKQITARRYHSNVMPRETQEGELVLRQVVLLAHKGKLQPNWKKLYHIFQKLSHGGCKLQKLDGQLVPMTWNSIRLKYYYN